jgi:hypothetical protein
MSMFAPSNDSNLHRVPEVLPSYQSCEWAELERKLMWHFLWENRRVIPHPIKSRLLLIHPSCENMIIQARAINNGDLVEDTDGDGNLIPLPRVWRWEHHFHVFFMIELPSNLSPRAALLMSGDRDYFAA